MAIFNNFTAADRKRNLKAFGMIPVGQDISWIANNPEPLTTANVTFSATPIFEVTNGSVQNITLTGDVTSSQITYLGSTAGTPDGTRLTLRICQDGTGGRLFRWPSTLRLDTYFIVDPTANYCTVLDLQYVFGSSKWECVAAPVSFPLS
jgi:hypothetical protein